MAESGATIGSLPKARKRKKTSAARIAFLIHSATGLWLTLLLTVVMVSGTITVIAGEIDWFIYPEARVTPQGEKLNPGLLMDAVEAAYPDYGIQSMTTGEYVDRKAVPAFASAPEGGFRLIWIDQWTGEVTGDTPGVTVGRFLNLLHTTLFLPLIGRAFVNFFGILMLVSLVTGLITYKKFWRGFLKRPRFSRNARTWLGDLHRLVALWSLWFLLVIGVTGTWWFYETPLVSMAGAPPIVEHEHEEPHLTQEELNALGPETPRRLPAAELVSAVQQTFPELKPTLLFPPPNAGEPFIVFADGGETLTFFGLNEIYINPYTAEIMGIEKASEVGALGRIDEAMLPLHFGSWGKRGWADIAVKTVWFAGGAALSFLCVSGLLIYMKRTREALAGVGVSPSRQWLVRGWNWVKPWGGPMGLLKYLNIAGLVAMGIGGYMLLALVLSGVDNKGYLYTQKQVGPLEIQLTALAGVLETGLPPIREGARTTVLPKVADGRFRDARFIWVTAGGTTPPEDPGASADGPEGLAQARVRLPAEFGPDARLWVTVEDWSGERYRQSWPLLPDGDEVLNRQAGQSGEPLVSDEQ